MLRTQGLLLSNMLQIVSNSHDIDPAITRANIMHPLRTMVNMKTNDEELNCIALGHELLNMTDVTLNDLVVAGMTDRILMGLILLKEAGTMEQTLDNICQSEDTMKVAMVCLLDRGALCSMPGMPTFELNKPNQYYVTYLRIVNYMKDIDTCKMLGLKRPLFA
jgi:hypothetical protein